MPQAEDRGRRVAVVGGGMAGLATAWHLTQPGAPIAPADVTVYQRGWRLGGKGASSRGVNDRIEEHGLHVLLGYYHSMFRMMDEVYAELDRPVTDPDCPIRSWDDAVFPAGRIGLTDARGESWLPWTTDFTTTPMRPGRPGAENRRFTVDRLVARSIRLLVDFHLGALRPQRRGGVALTTSPHPPRRELELTDAVAILRGLGVTALAGAAEVLDMLEDALEATSMRDAAASRLGRFIEAAEAAVGRTLTDDHSVRTRELVGLVLANLRGTVVDRLLTNAEGFRAVDGEDYRDWLRRHGASPATVDSSIVRGMYDLVFAYEHGDPDRPRFSAGLGLELAGRMLLDHDGGIFWKMTAGMGETVFAPLYQALLARGVRFEFFHRLDDIVLDGAGQDPAGLDDRTGVSSPAVSRLQFTRQIPGPGDRYEPLVRIGGLPCWPAAPRVDHPDTAHDLEHHWSSADHGRVVLEAGKDFDVAVLAVSIGMVPHVAGDLVRRVPGWREMVERIGTVATQALQVWLSAGEHDLGWDGPPGVVLSGFEEPFDTWASMPHLLAVEGWPAVEPPATIAYFCNALAEPPIEPGSDRERASALAAEARERVYANAATFLSHHVQPLWPGAYRRDGGFRWDLLYGPDATGPDRLRSQYWRANVDPSDRYVQSLPGTDRFRMAPGATGVANLVVAGDWTDCGLNAGCVEAAVRSGVLAARAVLGHGCDPPEAQTLEGDRCAPTVVSPGQNGASQEGGR